MAIRNVLACLVIGAAGFLAACASSGDARPPLETSAKIDLARYMGRWHVIARVDYFGERGDVASEDVYALDDKGNVATVYRYRKSFDTSAKVRTLGSTGLVQPDTGNAYWRIRFFGLFKADYLVLEVADDYSWALIGQPGRKLGWIFGREAVMPDALYADLLGRMQGYGYDPATLLRVAQVEAQVGKPGFHE